LFIFIYLRDLTQDRELHLIRISVYNLQLPVL
jgi:hypothetical protein